MGQIGFSRWRGTTGDAAHRPRVATPTKSQNAPPKAAFPHPLASLRGLACAPTSRGTARLAKGLWDRGQTDSIKPGKTLNPQFFETFEVERDSVARPVGRGGESVGDAERLGDKVLESEAMNFEVGRVGDRRQQVDMEVMHPV